MLSLLLLVASWQVQAGCAVSEGRFVMDGPDRFIDSQSLLMWQHCPQGRLGERCSDGPLDGFHWRGAVSRQGAVNAAALDGLQDWQIPSVAQLQSLFQAACGVPAQIPAGLYWSKNPSPKAGYLRQAVAAGTGEVMTVNGGTFGLHLWLVRPLEG
ncbi:DUF1566 domain-containing protein [Pseudaeromonas paramecii]|uniref:Lcl C-terminal domain-containing protein n=1 Tax=Pseudaeromonas paramecii TaxID=2138166 RepID=A0ABP8QFL8_9GAMM